MDLNIEALEAIEAPMSTMEGIGIALIALGSGIIVGALIGAAIAT